ncbi:MAG: cyclic nucleotide-binding/CBS domain-containing protein [Methyloceanibacter sp.]|jgi:CBS domain-containing protein|uniref:CBS domain-containing protein n=1 Tax=Methyloceanibacter sp. TaxID=1965321 RepID=UPI003565484A
MTNRQLAEILEDQTLLALGEHAPVQEACRCMWEYRKGSVLVIDQDGQLIGIFTGRDAVRILAEGRSADATPLAQAMTRNPVTVAPTARAIDALREMSDRGIRHLPVVENERILGVVSRGDFKGIEIDRLDEDDHLTECLR